MSKKVKGIGLLSGGLDSMLAARVLVEQGIEVLGITFVTPFFGAEKGLKAGEQIGIPMLALDISEKHLKMLKNPRYGYGSQMNPCIDCHGLMLSEAGKIMEEQGADFLFTGEVLGQRPMSQRRDAMRSVEKLSGYPGLILRPLSAKLLSATLVEENGLVDRSRLLDIQGRSRRRQTELARSFGLTDYPQPGGGCLLTNEGFSNRLRELFRINPGASVREVEIIKYGRAFILPGQSMCMVGRNEGDNLTLEKLAGKDEVRLRPADHPGPTGIIFTSPQPLEDLKTAAEIIASYSNIPGNTTTRIHWQYGEQSGTVAAEARSKDDLKQMLIA